ncbi:MSHA biogenesis protein MshI [Pseudoduganella violacea]|uniref:Tfp pilus assembly protein PilN n=1 Tax=Pseudoduganella violacea TaxID=1715466 RepID=A0A7W5BDP1_9BURK|nr:MSHA biogenesis protein MshI [Pseudoduganella violacea]MBB3121243.1 Tfp pilus assembly protein PilN [Pseudoduganella violacea]
MSQQINLFNPIFLKQKKIFTALHMAQALGAMALLLVALAAFLNYRSSTLQAEANAGKALVEASQARLNKANAEFVPRQKSKQLEAEIAQLQAQLQSLQEVEAVLKRGEIGNTEGYAEYFRAFARQNVQGLWLTGVNIVGAGQDIALQGRAMQAALIPAYIGRLKDEKSMRGKTFGALQITQPSAPAGVSAVPAAPAVSAPAAMPGLSQTPPPAGALANAPVAAVAPALPRYVQFSLQSQSVEEGKK